MPEIKMSDSVLGLARTFNQFSQVFGGIRADLYNKARVAAVNDGLIHMEEGFDEYYENAPKQSYEEALEDDESGVLVPKEFGEAQFYTINQHFDKYVQAQRDFINETVTHKEARQELLWNLEQKALSERGKLLREWDIHADAHAKSTLAKLYKATLEADIPWQDKVARIENRTTELYRAGRISKDAAQAIVQDMMDQSQYNFALGGALETIREASKVPRDENGMRPNPMDVGEAWVRENTPFYDGNPEAREKLLTEVKREWEALAKKEDAEFDQIYADLHITADTVNDIDLALEKLTLTEFNDGNQKYIWEQRFLGKRNYILSLMDIPDAAKYITDAQNAYADRLRAEISIGIAQGKPIGELREIVNEAYYNPMTNPDTGEPIAASLIAGSHVKEFNGMLDKGRDDFLATAISYADEMLDGADELEAVNEIEAWYEASPNATRKDIQEAIINIVEPIKKRRLDKWGGLTAQELLGDKAVMTAAERLALDISEGRVKGLTDLRAEELAVLNSVVLGLAQRDYPDQQIFSVFTDHNNGFKNGHGAPIMIGADNQIYGMKIEDKGFSLMRLATHKDGSRAWERVTSAAELQKQREEEEERQRRAPSAAEILKANEEPIEQTVANVAASTADAISEIPALDGGFGGNLELTVKDWAETEAAAAERRNYLEGFAGSYDLDLYEKRNGYWWMKPFDNRPARRVAKKHADILDQKEREQSE